MNADKTLIQKDLNHVWHPCSNMKTFKQYPPLIVERASGSYIYTDQGPLIDSISSWWCKSLGHGHPAVIAAIENQLKKFEHVIGANTTHHLVVELAEKLAEISGKQHVFFASDGSCAVEIAMKLALHATQLKGNPERNQFIALRHGYHGETLGTLAVSDLGLYKKPFDQINLTCHFLDPIPYVNDQNAPLWSDCQAEWDILLPQLELLKTKACAILVEPIVQGAGGMRCYSADFLRKLAAWAKKNNIYFIADEIMTGLGRTGKWLACQHAQIEPDLICLSKGLTSGSLPLSCVLIDHSIYELFYENEPFLHSHTYSGNPLAVSAALATLKVMQAEKINDQACELGYWMRAHFNAFAQAGKLTNVRSIGAIVAGDLVEKSGFAVAQAAQKKGALLRPIGNTLYWLPPLNTDQQTIERLAEITFNAICNAI